jgi:phenylalanyl-tRNA synthetase alpha subunit
MESYITMESNITKSIREKIGRNLHQNDSHPIGIIKNLIYGYFDEKVNKCKGMFEKYDSLDPIVSVENNFDLLLIPENHPARSRSDTYYVDHTNVLRTPDPKMNDPAKLNEIANHLHKMISDQIKKEIGVEIR